MTILQIMKDDNRDAVLLRTTDPAEIATRLDPLGVTLEHWPVRDIAPSATASEIRTTYRTEIDTVRRRGRYAVVDIVRMPTNADDTDPQASTAIARQKFLSEHRHTESEVRFFVAGQGCFYLHLGGNVLALVCEAGDLMTVPAGVPHWFDMGRTPHFCAIRFFEHDDGWIGHFTENPIATQMPTLDELIP